MLKPLSIPLQLSFGTFVCLSTSPILAQVTTDGTVNTQVNLQENISEITGGEARGSNLFHSFQDFSVPTGNEAFFNNAESINNIFSRVTGGNISNIDGLIRANGSASLFLINPAGIVFGENARLDIGGSFFGSTADSILFNDGEFSATDLDNPLLTINAPIGLNFRDNPGDVTVRGDGNGARLADSEVVDTQDALRVGENATIGFLGGNVLFEDATVKTAGGRIEVGSVADGTVDLVAVDNGFTFDYSQIDTFRDISLSGRSSIDASGLGGGDIQAAGNNISITGVSGFTSFTLGSTPGSDINIFAAESLDISGVENELDFVSAISSRAFPGSTADAGNINIETGSLTIGDRATISTTVFGQGNAGNININANDSINLESQGNSSTITSNVAADAVGNAGDVNLAANSVTLSDGSLISTENSANGRAGDVTINATEDVSFSNNSQLSVTGAPGGSIDISAKNLSITSGSSFFAGTNEIGSTEVRAGDIAIALTEDLVIDGQSNDGLTTISNTNNGIGNPGNINIAARNITFQNGGRIGTITSPNLENVSLGNVTLNATSDITFDGRGSFRSGIINGILENSTGTIGEINLTAQNLDITNGAAISSLVNGTGDSGDISLNVADTIKIDGFGDVSTTDSSATLPSQISSSQAGTGNAGSININTQNLQLSQSGNISSLLAGQGNAGDISINAEQITIGESENLDLNLNQIPSSISANTVGEAEGNGGNITINTGSLFIDDGSDIDVGIGGAVGNGGDLKINARDIVSFDGTNSDISAGVLNGEGDAGDIQIDTARLSVTNGAAIGSDISGGGIGNGGAIIINATDSVQVSGDDARITAEITTNSSGIAGDIEINTAQLLVEDNARVSAQILRGAGGDGGSIIINASDSVEVSKNFAVITTSIFDTSGNAGNIEINTPRLLVEDNANVSAQILRGAGGDGGSIIINASDLVEVSGDNATITTNIFDAIGNAGNIEINTPRLLIEDSGDVSAAIIQGAGAGGSITINATDLVQVSGDLARITTGIIDSNDANAGNIDIDTPRLLVDDASITANIDLSTNSNAGNIDIDTAQLSLNDRAFISTSIFRSDSGDGGTTNIRATDTIDLTGNSSVAAIVSPNASGTGGDLTIETSRLTLGDGSQISATTRGEGNAGNLTILATDSIDLSGISETRRGGLFASALVSSGDGGNLSVSTNELTIRDGATISASNFPSLEGAREPGTGQPGNISIEANTVNLTEGRIEATTQSPTGNAANISLQVSDRITLKNDSFISARAFNDANGGNLTIDTDFIIAFPEGNNDIIASSEQGRGGNITINAESLLGIEERPLNPFTNDINASSQVTGLEGTIDLTVPDINPIQGASQLPTNIVVPEETVAQACRANREIAAQNSFSIEGRGGIIPEPGLPLNSFNITVNGDDSTSTIPAPIETAQGKIQLARGIKVTESGEIILTAYRTNNAGERLPETKSCR